MAIVTTIDNAYQLQQLFNEYDRGDHFSYEGYKALYDYLDQLSDSDGEDYHVDVIDFCCYFTEYGDWAEVYEQYGYSYDNNDLDWYDIDQNDFIKWVKDRTNAIECYDSEDKLCGVIVENILIGGMMLYILQVTINGISAPIASSTSRQNVEWLFNTLKTLKQLGVLKIDAIEIEEEETRK